MIDRDTVQWFFRGFLVTALLMLAGLVLLRPPLGQAQEGEGEDANPNLAAADGQAATTIETDDPAGRNNIPAPAEDESFRSNNQPPSEAEAAASTGRTDDSLGRQFIPLADEGPVVPNIQAFDPNASTLIQSDTPREGRAGQIEGQDYRSPLVIPAADFSSDGFDPDGFRFSFSGGYLAGQSSNNCLQAPAYLPDDAVVYDFFVTFYDNNDSNNIFLELRRVNNFTGDVSVLASVQSSGASGTIRSVRDNTIANGTIIYPDYSYYVTTCLPATNLRLYSTRIYYSETLTAVGNAE